MHHPMSLVYTTVASFEQAEVLVKTVLKCRLAACVNILPQVTSFYYWQDELQTVQEHGILFKTIPEKQQALLTWLQQHHPYELPAIVSLAADTTEVFRQYLLQSSKAFNI